MFWDIGLFWASVLWETQGLFSLVSFCWSLVLAGWSWSTLKTPGPSIKWQAKQLSSTVVAQHAGQRPKHKRHFVLQVHKPTQIISSISDAFKCISWWTDVTNELLNDPKSWFYGCFYVPERKKSPPSNKTTDVLKLKGDLLHMSSASVNISLEICTIKYTSIHYKNK